MEYSIYIIQGVVYCWAISQGQKPSNIPLQIITCSFHGYDFSLLYRMLFYPQIPCASGIYGLYSTLYSVELLERPRKCKAQLSLTLIRQLESQEGYIKVFFKRWSQKGEVRIVHQKTHYLWYRKSKSPWHQYKYRVSTRSGKGTSRSPWLHENSLLGWLYIHEHYILPDL